MIKLKNDGDLTKLPEKYKKEITKDFMDVYIPVLQDYYHTWENLNEGMGFSVFFENIEEMFMEETDVGLYEESNFIYFSDEKCKVGWEVVSMLGKDIYNVLVLFNNEEGRSLYIPKEICSEELKKLLDENLDPEPER